MVNIEDYSPGVQGYYKRGQELMAHWNRRYQEMADKRFDTIAVHGMYGVEEAIQSNQGSVIEPLYASTSQAYENSDHMEAGLAYLTPNWCYSRIANPTMFYLEWALALLESYQTGLKASCCATSSGMGAIMLATDAFLSKRKSGPEEMNFVSCPQVYGGTFQQFNLRKSRDRGLKVRWVPNPLDLGEWEANIDDNTRFLYGEMPSNPQQGFFDLEAVAKLAHEHNLPFIVDSTIATPALMRPLAHGADVVVHSTTKSLNTSGFGIGGALISRPNITSELEYEEGPPDWKEDFATWVKFWPGRDQGPNISPFNALMTLNDLRTLRSRMDLVSRNSLEVAQYLESDPHVEQVDYLGLESDPLHKLACKYLKLADTDENRFGHLLSFRVKGGASAARRVFDALRMIFRATDLGRIKSVATIPAISTHSQQGEEAREMADVPPNLIRLCVGAEDPRDVIDDLKQALKKA